LRAGQWLGGMQSKRQEQTSPMSSRTISVPLGREQEVKAVLASLKQHSAAFIWAGPGEGKTTIAMEAAEQLRSHKEHSSAFEIDMQGESSASL